MNIRHILSYAIVILAAVAMIWTTSAVQPLPVEARQLPSNNPLPLPQEQKSVSYAGGGLFAYVNQPWDWIEGTTIGGATVEAALLRDGSQVAAAQTTADSSGKFALLFAQNGQPVDILEGDQVSVSDGTNAISIGVIPINGMIDVVNDSVSGKMENGTFPTTAIVGVSRPSDPTFITKSTNVAADGTFAASFAGEVDLVEGYVAKVWYTDSNGNQVRKILYSNGLNVRARINEDIVEGITSPGTEIEVTVKDKNAALKGTASCVGDRTGYYATQITSNGATVDLVETDTITAMASAFAQSVDLNINVSNYSQIDAVNDIVTGSLSGGVYPAFGRINLWNARSARWYFKDITIDASGNYTADFSGVVDVNIPDRVRVWYIDPNGNDIASLSTGLEVGVSTTSNTVWGYTAPNETVHGLITQNGSPSPYEADWTADADGYFQAALSGQLSLAPQDQITVSVSGNQVSFAISAVYIKSNYAGQTIVIQGIPNSVLQISIARTGASFWKEVNVGADGLVKLDLDSSYTIQPMDYLSLSFYQPDQGITIHQAFILDYYLFLSSIQN